mmetsp:Transcript_29087/g.59500  ORF Transcript_29087/g.59500 Transcript_29087/m.59500 type:complete len:292 (+) Transcript_29087:608-1483(+)
MAAEEQQTAEARTEQKGEARPHRGGLFGTVSVAGPQQDSNARGGGDLEPFCEHEAEAVGGLVQAQSSEPYRSVHRPSHQDRNLARPPLHDHHQPRPRQAHEHRDLCRVEHFRTPHLKALVFVLLRPALTVQLQTIAAVAAAAAASRSALVIVMGGGSSTRANRRGGGGATSLFAVAIVVVAAAARKTHATVTRHSAVPTTTFVSDSVEKARSSSFLVKRNPTATFLVLSFLLPIVVVNDDSGPIGVVTFTATSASVAIVVCTVAIACCIVFSLHRQLPFPLLLVVVASVNF